MRAATRRTGRCAAACHKASPPPAPPSPACGRSQRCGRSGATLCHDGGAGCGTGAGCRHLGAGQFARRCRRRFASRRNAGAACSTPGAASKRRGIAGVGGLGSGACCTHGSISGKVTIPYGSILVCPHDMRVFHYILNYFYFFPGVRLSLHPPWVFRKPLNNSRCCLLRRSFQSGS